MEGLKSDERNSTFGIKSVSVRWILASLLAMAAIAAIGVEGSGEEIWGQLRTN